MVVNHVQQHGQPEPVRLVHQPAQVIGPAVAPRRGEQIDPVIAPVAPAGEIGHRHQLDRIHAKLGQLGQAAGDPVEGSIA